MKNAFEVKKTQNDSFGDDAVCQANVLGLFRSVIRCSTIGKMIDFFVTKKPKLR